MIRQPTTILPLAPFPDFSMMIGMLEAIKTTSVLWWRMYQKLCWYFIKKLEV